MRRLGLLRDAVLRHGTAAATVGAVGFIAVLMVVPAAPGRNGEDSVRTFVWECHSQGDLSAGAPLELVRAIEGTAFGR